MLNNSKRIRIAIIGCGRISSKHLDAISSLENLYELVGVCDNNEEARKLIARKFLVPEFEVITEMLAAVEPDIAVLCTPSGLHYEQAKLVADSMVGILTEKPMAINWRDGADMVEYCKEKSVNLFVVKQMRGNPVYKMVKKLLDEKRFGKVFTVNLNVFWTRPQSYYDEAPWRGTWAFDGGAFMNQASHYFDLLDWFFGPVARVQAMTATLARNIEAEDTGVMNLQWESGALGSVAVSMLAFPKNLESSITILGERGTLKLGGQSGNDILHWSFEDSDLAGPPEMSTLLQTPHAAYYESIAKFLNGEVSDIELTDGASGLKSLELIEAAYRSSRNGETSLLPLKK